MRVLCYEVGWPRGEAADRSSDDDAVPIRAIQSRTMNLHQSMPFRSSPLRIFAVEVGITTDEGQLVTATTRDCADARSARPPIFDERPDGRRRDDEAKAAAWNR